MNCPKCSAETGVIDSRLVTLKHGQTIRRRRECLTCSERFTTYEHFAEESLEDRLQVVEQSVDAFRALAAAWIRDDRVAEIRALGVLFNVEFADIANAVGLSPHALSRKTLPPQTYAAMRDMVIATVGRGPEALPYKKGETA